MYLSNSFLYRTTCALDEVTSIAFAFPTSDNAETLGFEKVGCWYVSQTRHDIEGSGQSCTYLPHDAVGFDRPDHPDLIELFDEYEGELCPHFLAYGNAKALEALGLES